MAAPRVEYLTFNEELGCCPMLNDLGTSDDITETMELPLQTEWKIWEQIETADTHGSHYTDNMKAISKFATVQEFWQFWNVLPQPSQLMADKRMIREVEPDKIQMVDAIMIFRDGVKPMWEDPSNASGGHFEMRYTLTRDPHEQAKLDEHWNHIVLAIVGSTVEPMGMVTGVRLVDKLHQTRGHGFVRIEIWFSDYNNIEARNQLKSNLEKAITTRLQDGKRDPLFRLPAPKPHFKVDKHSGH